MSHTVIEKQDDLALEGKADVDHSEVLKNSDLMNDAFDGENREHELGVWEATKKHPWACFWAFIMCFTIVSSSSRPHADPFSIHDRVMSVRWQQ